MKKLDARDRVLIERKKRNPFSSHARQKALLSHTEHADRSLMGWSPSIRARKIAAYKSHQELDQRIRKVIERCLTDHPGINAKPDIRAGLPHIRGSRITVQYILDRLSVHGTVKGVAKLLPHITEAQIKEAIAYARDFMERACGQSEADDR